MIKPLVIKILQIVAAVTGTVCLILHLNASYIADPIKAIGAAGYYNLLIPEVFAIVTASMFGLSAWFRIFEVIGSSESKLTAIVPIACNATGFIMYLVACSWAINLDKKFLNSLGDVLPEEVKTKFNKKFAGSVNYISSR